MSVGRNYSLLANENPICGIDDHIEFDEDRHVYTVNCVIVPRSVTKVVGDVLAEQPFDADAIILRNMSSWRAKPASKYGSMIRQLNDADATSTLKTLWSNANVLGTKLHKRLEACLNDALEPEDGETDVEWQMLQTEVERLQSLGWVPRRTELSLWWERESDGKVVCAGQLDALFTDANDELVLVDLKRTDHDLSPTKVPFGGKRCMPPLETLYASDFVKYSLQQSIYAVLFKQRTGLEIAPGRRYLLQVHPSLEMARWTQCVDLDVYAVQLLNALE